MAGTRNPFPHCDETNAILLLEDVRTLMAKLVETKEQRFIDLARTIRNCTTSTSEPRQQLGPPAMKDLNDFVDEHGHDEWVASKLQVLRAIAAGAGDEPEGTPIGGSG